jgi:hypothetical protein
MEYSRKEITSPQRIETAWVSAITAQTCVHTKSEWTAKATLDTDGSFILHLHTMSFGIIVSGLLN